MVYDIDNKKFVNELKLPEFPQPATNLLINTISDLLKSKEKFMNVPNASIEKIVFF